MIAVYTFLVVTAVMSVFQLCVVMWEKRLSWPYGALQGTPPHPDPSGYCIKTVGAALECGFMLIGWTPDMKGEKYQMNYGFLLSPDRQSLAMISKGKIIGIEVRGLSFHSPSQDGLRSWYTTDNQSGVESDILRRWMSHLVFVSAFKDIWQAHQTWMESAQFPRHTFNPGCALQEFRRIREQRFGEMLARGYIAYTDESQTFWRYTFKGAVRLVFYNYGTGLIRAFTLGRFPKTA